MTDIAPRIRNLARQGRIRYTKHARDRMVERQLTVMQIKTMLKNCTHRQDKDDGRGYRVEGRAPASNNTGSEELSAHVAIIGHNSGEQVLVITVIR